MATQLQQAPACNQLPNNHLARRRKNLMKLNTIRYRRCGVPR